MVNPSVRTHRYHLLRIQRLETTWKLKQWDLTGMFLWQKIITQCKWTEIKYSSRMGFHEGLERSIKNPRKICSILSLIWTDRTDLKIHIFSILTTGEKYHASRQRPKKRKQKMKLSLSRKEISMDRLIL